MKKKHFSVEQIVGVLKQAEVGVPVAEVTYRLPADSIECNGCQSWAVVTVGTFVGTLNRKWHKTV